MVFNDNICDKYFKVKMTDKMGTYNIEIFFILKL